MDFTIKPVSKGKGSKSFKLYLPFGVSKIGRMQESGKSGEIESTTINLDGIDATIRRKDHFYVLEASGFKTKSEAENFLARISLAFMLASIKQKVTIEFQSKAQPIDIEVNKLFRDAHNPEAYKHWRKRKDGTYTDGGVWSNQTVIIPEHKRIVEYPMAWGSRINILTTNSIRDSFLLAKDFKVGQFLKSKKLMLAFKLYSNAYSNIDLQVTFLNLVTILEVLGKTEKPISETSQKVLNMAKKIVKEERNKHKKGFEYSELENLLGRVGKLKERSISQEIRDYVFQSLYTSKRYISGITPLTQAESNNKIKEIYSIRSELVHTGEIKQTKTQTAIERFNESFTFIQEIMPFLLINEMGKSKLNNMPIDIKVLNRDY